MAALVFNGVINLKFRNLIIGLGLISPLSYAASYTAPSLVTNMSVGKDMARVKTANISASEGCAKSEWYILDFNTNASAEMYSMLLAAKASRQKVHFQLIGCHMDYPKVSHVYNCDNANCSN